MWCKLLLLVTSLRLTSCGILVPPNKSDWWENAIIYEIFPLSFKDSDGDGSGDFQGIIQKLDYLIDLGVTAIWLTPFLESPLESGGYDITNYTNVQYVFGTMKDFKALVDAIHKKNLKFIMDFVPNHTSDKHVWFEKSVNKSSEYTDYYVWKDAKNQKEVIGNSSVTPIEPNNWITCIGEVGSNSAWFWHNTRKQFYFSQFINNLPELNFYNENVHKEMKTILNFWLELGVDGIRIDALRHVYESKNMKDEPIINPRYSLEYLNIDHIYTVDQDEVYDLIKEWRLILDEFTSKYGTTRIIMTESYSPLDVLFKYYTSGAHIPTNFNLINNTYHYTPKDFSKQIENWITKMPPGAIYNVVLQNHDRMRVPTWFGSELTDAMNALSLFLPGIAIVYYGGEIGMEDISDKIQFARSPMQWNNLEYAGFTENSQNGSWVEVHPNYVKRNVQTQMNDPKSNLNFFKSVSRLRQTETLKRGGLATYLFNDDTVFVLNRFLPGYENYTLVINMNPNSQHVRLSDRIIHMYRRKLTVVIASRNSNFSPGNLISAESLSLSPGAAIILTDKTLINDSTKDTKPYSSSSSQWYITFEVLLFCLSVTIICRL